MAYKIGFIGAGNMGGCLIEAAAKAISAKDICVFDSNNEKTKLYTESCGVFEAELSAVLDSEMIVIGVKPQNYSGLIENIKEKLCNRTDNFSVISMAAGITIASIHKMFGKNIPVIRIMPNMACGTNEGVMVYDVSENVSERSKQLFCEAFKYVGLLDRIEEKLIDAACSVTGCGPAYAYMFIEALADGAVACGLPRNKAVEYSAQMLKGAALTVLNGMHPEELKDKVCSPGGSTIEGVLALERGGFRGNVNSAVIAAYLKNVELGKKNID